MVRKLAVGLVSVLVLILGGCISSPEILTPKFDDTSRIAILSAFEPEMKGLLRKTNINDTYVINGRRYHIGQLAGREVVLCLSGVSMVNAAMTTQTVLDHFNVSRIVFSGIAGGVNPDLRIGDVIVPEQWGQYQEQLFARETEGGWDLGWYSEEFSNFGMMFPQNVSVTQKGKAADSEKELFWFQVDPGMLSVAQQAINEVQLNRCTAQRLCLETEPRIFVGGNGVSGSTFVDNAEYREWIWDTFQANAVDMESAAAAHVAFVNDVPFIAFRSLSDLAGGGSGENEVEIFFQLASDNSAELVIAFLEIWREN